MARRVLGTDADKARGFVVADGQLHVHHYIWEDRRSTCSGGHWFSLPLEVSAPLDADADALDVTGAPFKRDVTERWRPWDRGLGDFARVLYCDHIVVPRRLHAPTLYRTADPKKLLLVVARQTAPWDEYRDEYRTLTLRTPNALPRNPVDRPPRREPPPEDFLDVELDSTGIPSLRRLSIEALGIIRMWDVYDSDGRVVWGRQLAQQLWDLREHATLDLGERIRSVVAGGEFSAVGDARTMVCEEGRVWRVVRTTYCGLYIPPTYVDYVEYWLGVDELAEAVPGTHRFVEPTVVRSTQAPMRGVLVHTVSGAAYVHVPAVEQAIRVWPDVGRME